MESDAMRDKVIVVIGGTRGLGLSGALALVKAGAKVVAVGNDPGSDGAAREALGDSGVTLAADACESGAADDAIGRAVEMFGGFHGLYHVAGGSGRRFGDGALHEVTDEGWERTLELNMRSVFYSNRAAVRQFLKHGGGGAILNMGSVLAVSPSPRHFGTFAYAAAKSAIVGMTRAAAAAYAGEDIRFNVVAPGLVDTPMARRAVGDERIAGFVRSKQPLDGGRVGRADDLDAAVVYLLSDGARFVTGQVLAVDGGWGVTDGSAE